MSKTLEQEQTEFKKKIIKTMKTQHKRYNEAL